MTLKVSKRRPQSAQSAIRNMTLQCARVGGGNPVQGVCDPLVLEDAMNRLWRSAK